MRDGLSRGLLETLLILAGMSLVVLDATGTLSGLAGGSFLISSGIGLLASRSYTTAKRTSQLEETHDQD